MLHDVVLNLGRVNVPVEINVYTLATELQSYLASNMKDGCKLTDRDLNVLLKLRSAITRIALHAGTACPACEAEPDCQECLGSGKRSDTMILTLACI